MPLVGYCSRLLGCLVECLLDELRDVMPQLDTSVPAPGDEESVCDQIDLDRCSPLFSLCRHE